MRDKLVLHVLTPDKFTMPMINYLNKELGEYNQVFLCISKPQNTAICNLPNVFYLKNPHSKNLFGNTRLVLKYFRNASKILMHGNPALYYFFIFRFAIKKIYWIIYGGSDLGTKEENRRGGMDIYIKRNVLKKIFGHITHIEGDSQLANEIFFSKARFFYSPMYLSNVIRTEEYTQSKAHTGTIKILMGNNTDPRNCHSQIFDLLLPYQAEDIKIYCPLSYGPYEEYKKKIIEKGNAMFSNKFIPVTDFMSLEAYREFLNSMDLAILNHKTQAGMGVITSLFAMGKIVYSYAGTTAFQSLVSRGFRLFDIDQIKNGNLLKAQDVTGNIELIKKYYSPEALKASYIEIYENEIFN